MADTSWRVVRGEGTALLGDRSPSQPPAARFASRRDGGRSRRRRGRAKPCPRHLPAGYLLVPGSGCGCQPPSARLGTNWTLTRLRCWRPMVRRRALAICARVRPAGAAVSISMRGAAAPDPPSPGTGPLGRSRIRFVVAIRAPVRAHPAALNDSRLHAHNGTWEPQRMESGTQVRVRPRLSAMPGSLQLPRSRIFTDSAGSCSS
jgi:hypothetical protein